MVNIALRRSSKRAPTDIQIVPRSKVQNRVRQDNQSPDLDDGSDSDSEDRSSSPKSPKGPSSPKSPDSPSSTTQTFAPTLPPATTANVLPPPAPTSIIAPPPPAATTQPTVIQPVVTQPVATTQPAATTPVQPAPPPPAQTSATTTTVPTTTLAGPVTTLTPIAPPQLPVTATSVPVLVKDPARETDNTTSEPPSPTSPVTSLPQPTTTALASPFTTLTPIAPPRTTTSSSIDSTTTSSGQSTTATSSPSSTSSGATTLVTTRFVLSSTSVVDGIPTTLLITLPSAPAATTLLTKTSSTSTSTRQKETITSGAGLVPVESAAPITLPSNTTASPSGDSRDSLSNAPGVLSVGGVAALSLIIALASIATIVFVVYKCCWPRLSRGRPASAVLPAWVPGRRFWDKPRPAARGIGPTAPDMAHVRPGDKIMDQVMAAAYEAEQGNAGVYGRYAAERRGSWHTDDSSILEEKQRQYEAAVAASAINGTAPPDPRKSKALHLGQMMNAFLKDRHERPAASAQEVEMPHSPPGTTSGPTAFMPKNHQVEWSWRVSVRRASQNLRGGEGGDGWFSKVTRLGGSKP